MNNKNNLKPNNSNYNKQYNKKMNNNNNRIISAPLAKTKLAKYTKPKFGNRGSDGRIRISHHEYIKDIQGSVDYAQAATEINPGLPTSFPWLNVIAVGYETYKFVSLKFEFTTSKSATSSGSVMMAVDFDSDDSAPANKTQLLAYNNAVRGPVWNNFTYNCSPQDLHKFNQKFIRFGNLSAGIEKKLYDVGVLYIATAGMSDTTTIGELHVTYVIELITPQFDLAAYSLATSAKLVAVGAITPTNWLGTSTIATGGVSTTTTPGLLTINVPGQYLFTIIIAGSGFGGGSPVFTSAGNQFTILNYLVVPTAVTLTATAVINTATQISLAGLYSGSATSSVLRISYYNSTLA